MGFFLAEEILFVVTHQLDKDRNYYIYLDSKGKRPVWQNVQGKSMRSQVAKQKLNNKLGC